MLAHERVDGPWERGIWNNKSGNHFDESLAKNLKKLFKGLSILDLGCGWKKLYATYLGADGYDGNRHTLDGSILDISEPFDLGKKYDVVICLEVIEHISAKYECTVLDNICKHTRDFVVLSWARPGQKGRHHVNCQPKEYVIEQMNQRGFEMLPATSDEIRKQCVLAWFKKNILIFRTSQT